MWRVLVSVSPLTKHCCQCRPWLCLPATRWCCVVWFNGASPSLCRRAEDGLLSCGSFLWLNRTMSFDVFLQDRGRKQSVKETQRLFCRVLFSPLKSLTSSNLKAITFSCGTAAWLSPWDKEHGWPRFVQKIVFLPIALRSWRKRTVPCRHLPSLVFFFFLT